MLLFLAHSFSLVTGNPLFHKYLNTLKTEASVSGLLPFLGPEKDLLFVRCENSFVFMLHQWQMHDSLTVYFPPAARLPIFSAHRITFLLNMASYVKCFFMGKN
jgi:hypothetical protein